MSRYHYTGRAQYVPAGGRMVYVPPPMVGPATVETIGFLADGRAVIIARGCGDLLSANKADARQCLLWRQGHKVYGNGITKGMTLADVNAQYGHLVDAGWHAGERVDLELTTWPE